MFNLWIALPTFLVIAVAGFSGSFLSTRHDAQRQKIGHANSLSQDSASNITAAHEACNLWAEILHQPDPSLSPMIQALSLVLYASCLVRIGNDEDALVAFHRAAELSHTLDQQTREKITIGTGASLQRLMRYHESMEEYCRGNSPEAICGAAICALRVGNASMARRLLEPRRNTHFRIDSWLAILQWLQGGQLEDFQMEPNQLLSSDEIIIRWILSLGNKEGPRLPKTCPVVQLASISIGPFDDPLLLHLDDKIYLHRLLDGRWFWPPSLVLPDDAAKWAKVPDDVFWMKKKRAGYGSHGNNLVQQSQVLPWTEPVLLQTLIDPTYLLPPDGRKFSMRIYVIYFLPLADGTSSEFFVSRNGLVKLAARPVDSNASFIPDPMIYMTNSGRSVEMRQETLSFLEDNMRVRNHSFDLLWSNIAVIVQEVMQAFDTEIVTKANLPMQEYRASLARMGVPKILGFDFLVGPELHPWLVEVNRFPGLEPRNSIDESVKSEVLQEAWTLAAQRFK